MRRSTWWPPAVGFFSLRRACIVGIALPGALFLTLTLWRWEPILIAPVASVAHAGVREESAAAMLPVKPRPKPTPKPKSHSSPTLDPTPTDVPNPTALPTMTTPTQMPTGTATSTTRSGAKADGAGKGSATAMDASLLASLGWGLGAIVVGGIGFSLVTVALRPQKGRRKRGQPAGK